MIMPLCCPSASQTSKHFFTCHSWDRVHVEMRSSCRAFYTVSNSSLPIPIGKTSQYHFFPCALSYWRMALTDRQPVFLLFISICERNEGKAKRWGGERHQSKTKTFAIFFCNVVIKIIQVFLGIPVGSPGIAGFP